MTKENINTTNEINHIYYPPGGILIWIIIFLELITFGMAIVAFTLSSNLETEVFKQSSNQLNLFIGTTNTVLLLLSGYFMAKAIQDIKREDLVRFKSSIVITMVLGLLFIVFKCVEYFQKIQQGIFIDTNTFYSYYWFLTLFHLVHVLVGLVILLLTYYSVKKSNQIILDNIEASGAFWHMCDLIWLLIFPILYLMN